MIRVTLLTIAASICVGCTAERVALTVGAPPLDPRGLAAAHARFSLGEAESRRDFLAESERMSFYLLQVQGRSPRVMHRRHDVTLFVHRGAGQVRLGRDSVAARMGDVFVIPRDTPYQVLAGHYPLVAVLAFTPRYGGDDTIARPSLEQSFPRAAEVYPESQEDRQPRDE
jgi:mannose-6-phosphate isomerase-like protein (cupin superfamily)